ncbi:MAG: hypothetical protein D6734_00515 [Candidatus Schekmanbacteria bacterium]|nr:MAG: hypothetical protein D6734_00515 [Candidatus Schekmanbacteria bacterium]
MASKKIKITFENFSITGLLHETSTAEKILKALPIKSKANLWGDEIYFSVNIDDKLDETAKEEVNEGDIGFWPEGPALCFFFGPTPISPPGKILPASAVNIVGKLEGDLSQLRTVKNAETIRIELEE